MDDKQQTGTVIITIMKTSGRKETTSRGLNITIILLSILLTLSIGGLVAQYLYLNFFAQPPEASITLPDNQIGEKPKDETANKDTQDVTASVMELSKGHAQGGSHFLVNNMLPGDTETAYFHVQAHHKQAVALLFNVEGIEQTNALAEVLHLKVTNVTTGKVLCEDSFTNLQQQVQLETLLKNDAQETASLYKIDVSLDTSVGNQYQKAQLRATFTWSITDEDALVDTGNHSSTYMLAMIVFASSLLLILIGIKNKRGNKNT